jgi:ABC-type Mn2+/Zn2+ transport system ATPase subunit
MFGRVRLYDYRCFWREEPATLELQAGFTSFIGPNNAGKSTLIRAVYELRYAISQLATIRNNPQSMLNPIRWNLQPPLHEHAEIITDRDAPACAVELEPFLLEAEKPNSVTKARLEFLEGGDTFRCRLFSDDGREIGVQNSPTAIANYVYDFLIIGNGEKFSLAPLFRFTEMIGQIQYFGPFRNAINEGAGGHFDTQIGTGFISQWHQWKTGATKQQNRAIERVTEDVRRLFGAKTLEINASNELKTLQVVVDRHPHKLQELGAGFSQLVVVLGNALIRQPSFVLIDEPELHLHPALQSEFLTTLATYARHGVLYTTHSMGLARLADFCYTVQRRGERSMVRPFERTPHYAEFLGSLGIAGLRELGWDRVLLVEGPKDVRTLQQLLRLFGKDRQTIVLPLGGDSMVNGAIAHELSEVRRLCERVLAVVDSERTSDSASPMAAREQFAKVCAGLGIECCVTERRAIENYISQQALDRVWGSGRFRALAPYDAPPKDGSFWGKGESWRAAANLEREEVDSTDLGRFLSRV